MNFNITDTGVTGDTKILTDEGYLPIASLVDTTVPCWNGIEWSLTTIFKTSNNQEVFDVNTAIGRKLQITLGHKWTAYKSTGIMYTDTEITTKDFRLNNVFSRFSLPIVISKLDSNIKKLSELLHSKIYWGNPDHNGLQLYIKDKELAVDITLLLQELGVHSTVLDSSLGYHLSRDKELQLKYGFMNNQVYIIPISNKYVEHLQYLGLQIELSNQKDAKILYTDGIISITTQGCMAPTYSGIEPKRGRLMFNGILLGDSSPITN